VTALVCPACGGALQPPTADAVSVRCPYCGLAVQLARTAPIYQPAPEPPLSWKWLWFGIPLIAAIAYLLVTGSGPKQVRNGPNGKLALVHRFGDEGVGAGEFTDLRGFAAGNGLIFTQERKGRVQAFDLTGRQAGSWILPGEFSHFGFVASTDGSVYKPYDRILRRFEGKSGKALGEFDSRTYDLANWRFLAPGPSGTLFAADDRTAVQIDPATAQVLMRSHYRKPFKLSGGLTHFVANPLGEVYFADMAEHDVVRVTPDGQLKGRFVTTKLKGLTPLTMAMATLPVSARLGIATALGLELYDPEGRLLDMIKSTPLTQLAAPDEKHFAGWINYSNQVWVFEVK
jgi:hypothetical protein